MAAQNTYSFPAVGIFDTVSEFVRIVFQAEILFLSGLRMPDVLVSFGDDPVIGKVPIGMLSVKPCTYGIFGIFCERQ